MTSRKINLLTPKDLMSRLLMGDVGSTRKETCVDYYYVLSDTKSAIVYSATYLYTICAGGGNAGGSGGGGESNTSKKKEIINKITDPCLKNTINEALASNKDVKGFLSEVINKFSGLNNGIIINLYNGDINLPAGTSSKLENGVFTANITFKNRHYDDVTKEAVVATLIHEVVHAYLLKTNNAYKALPKEDQHNYLFTNFVKDIAGYLKSKYNMPSTDAWGLAWAGMGDVFNAADDNTAFQTEPGETMTKNEIISSMAPYNHTDKNAGAKGTPNCPQ